MRWAVLAQVGKSWDTVLDVKVRPRAHLKVAMSLRSPNQSCSWSQNPRFGPRG